MQITIDAQVLTVKTCDRENQRPWPSNAELVHGRRRNRRDPTVANDSGSIGQHAIQSNVRRNIETLLPRRGQLPFVGQSPTISQLLPAYIRRQPDRPQQRCDLLIRMLA